MQNDNFGLIVIAVTALAGLLLAPISCTDDSGSRAALESAGYSNVRLGDYAWFACGKDDSFATKFVATNPAGKQTSGVVCCGWMKGCTIRH